MKDKITLTAIVVEDESTLSYIEVCQRLQIPEELLHEMEEQGLFISITVNQDSMLNQRALQRIEAACRLQQDLGLNLPGAVLALELLDELEELRKQLSILGRHF